MALRHLTTETMPAVVMHLSNISVHIEGSYYYIIIICLFYSLASCCFFLLSSSFSSPSLLFFSPSPPLSLPFSLSPSLFLFPPLEMSKLLLDVLCHLMALDPTCPLSYPIMFASCLIYVDSNWEAGVDMIISHLCYYALPLSICKY